MNGVYGIMPPERAVAFAPGGYLTLVTGTVAQINDQASKTVVYYTPATHGAIPIIRNGVVRPFYFTDDLQLTLTSAHVLSSIYDVFAVSVGDRVRLVTGVAWGTITAGSGARGTGAGTTELTRAAGILVNKYPMPGLNGDASAHIPSLEGTYLGSINIDGTAGQVTNHKVYGQSRKWSVWNAYNRLLIEMQLGDATASWNYVTNTVRQSRADSTNTMTTFYGLPEEATEIRFVQKVIGGTTNAASSSNVTWDIGISFNAVTNAYVAGSKVGSSGLAGALSAGTVGLNLTSDSYAYYKLGETIGAWNINALERCTSAVGTSVSCNFQGGQDDMLMTATWRG